MKIWKSDILTIFSNIGYISLSKIGEVRPFLRHIHKFGSCSSIILIKNDHFCHELRLKILSDMSKRETIKEKLRKNDTTWLNQADKMGAKGQLCYAFPIFGSN